MKQLAPSPLLLLTLFTILLHSSQLVADDRAGAPTYQIEVVKTYPHDAQAFTQGLLYHDGFLYESTGLNGRSSLRKVELETGKVLKLRRIKSQFFAEGLALWNGKLIQLTWQAGLAFVYDRDSFRQVKTMSYPGEGWGLTRYGSQLVMSDGSSELRFLDPATFHEIRRIQVHDAGKPVLKINELESIKGEIYANLWQENRVARINPKNGKVTAWLEMAKLAPKKYRDNDQAVLNGIAYDAARDRIFVTGKMWDKLYEIKVVE
ncbi:glutaminyl-peptide cyclotransferase [Rubritalea marina]|uniref:glutaminyl-peptide cyclotransferase n=1 Tax=Rubritalea marina TaxID=361055 RepID=UPI00037C19A7|nr:glutaminyl-peptide cyclotransferase [Rubritalea marina]